MLTKVMALELGPYQVLSVSTCQKSSFLWVLSFSSESVLLFGILSFIFLFPVSLCFLCHFLHFMQSQLVPACHSHLFTVCDHPGALTSHSSVIFNQTLLSCFSVFFYLMFHLLLFLLVCCHKSAFSFVI